MLSDHLGSTSITTDSNGNKVSEMRYTVYPTPLRFLLDDDDDHIADILKLYSGNALLANRPKLIVEYYVP